MLKYKNYTKYKQIGNYAYKLFTNSQDICVAHDIMFVMALNRCTHIAYYKYTGSYKIVINPQQLIERIKGIDKWHRSSTSHLPKFNSFIEMLKFAVYHEIGHYVACDIGHEKQRRNLSEKEQDESEIAADLYAIQQMNKRRY